MTGFVIFSMARKRNFNLNIAYEVCSLLWVSPAMAITFYASIWIIFKLELKKWIEYFQFGKIRIIKF